jgi:hypothetical protein
MERPPPVLPAVLDLRRARTAEDVPDALLTRGVGVRDQFDGALALDLLEAVRKEGEHGGARLLDALVADLDGDAPELAQRNALFSLSKKLSS